jgi:hypothetical protein
MRQRSPARGQNECCRPRSAIFAYAQ